MQPDASLGLPTAFDSATVRNALLFAMQMGAPADGLKATFIRRGEGVQYFHRDDPATPLDPTTVQKDRDGKPLNSQIIAKRADDTEVEVDVAIEITEVPPDELPVGNFSPTKATVTLMHQEFLLIQGCQEMRFNNERYAYSEALDANGLFDMTFHTLIYFKRGAS